MASSLQSSFLCVCYFAALIFRGCVFPVTATLSINYIGGRDTHCQCAVKSNLPGMGSQCIILQCYN